MEKDLAMNAEIVEKTLDILRDTADDIEREGDIGTTTARLVIRASATTLESEIKRLRESLRMIVCESINMEEARDLFYRGVDRGDPMSWMEVGPDEIWEVAWNAALKSIPTSPARQVPTQST
mgnify:CR=1 FL=1|jgi:hypothetical protein